MRAERGDGDPHVNMPWPVIGCNYLALRCPALGQNHVQYTRCLPLGRGLMPLPPLPLLVFPCDKCIFFLTLEKNLNYDKILIKE